jgi:TPR repeat protein
MELFARAANAGLEIAKTDLGLEYMSGMYLPRDPQRAVALFKEASKHESAPAMFNLGLAYEDGSGVKQDLAKAFELYRRAAATGFAPAQNNLGRMYLEGMYVERDAARAQILLMAAAQQGNVHSYLNLAKCHLEGCGGAPDEFAAYGWFLAAKNSGSEIASAFVSMFTPLATRLSASQLATATTNAEKWRAEHVTDPLISNVKLDHIPVGGPIRASRSTLTIRPTLQDEALTRLWQQSSARQRISPPNSVR